MKIETVKIITLSQKELAPIMPLIEQLEKNGFDTNEISLNDLYTLYHYEAEIPIEDVPKQGKIILRYEEWKKCGYKI